MESQMINSNITQPSTVELMNSTGIMISTVTTICSHFVHLLDTAINWLKNYNF